MTTKGPSRRPRLGARHDHQEVQRQLVPLIDALLHPDDARRRANVEAVLRVLLPVTKALVVDALIDRLGNKNEVSTRVISTLSHFGIAALARLTQRFKDTRRAALQHSIIDTLTTMAPALDADQRSALLAEAMSLPDFTADNDVRERVGALIELLGRRAQARSQDAMIPTPGGDNSVGRHDHVLPRIE